MASRNIVIKNNSRCYESALQLSLWTSSLPRKLSRDPERLQLAGSSSTVFAVNLVPYFCEI